MIGRRDILTLLGGTAVVWPLAARAQQRERMRRIGVLMPTSEADAERRAQLKVFLDSLAALGWAEGRNVTFEYRWTGASGDLARATAKELVAKAPDLILTQSVQMVTALRDETRTIPILFAGASDPVELGLVDSLARPGGNITGFTGLQAATTVKLLEVIKRLDPRVTRALILMSSRDPSNEGRSRAIEAGDRGGWPIAERRGQQSGGIDCVRYRACHRQFCGEPCRSACHPAKSSH
jgi:putative ABC transport system substrate-binding protein